MPTQFFTPRIYQSSDDLDAMYKVLQAGSQAGTDCYYAHVGDLNWWLFYYFEDNNPIRHTYLWDDPVRSGELLGWMIIDPVSPEFDMFIHPSLLGSPLAGEMYTYAEEQAFALANSGADKPLHFLSAGERDAWLRAHLEVRGFKRTAWTVYFERDLAEPVRVPPLPEGFSLQQCRGLAELEPRARAQYHAFFGENPKMPFDKYLRRFIRFMESTAYQEALDLMTVAPDGRVASFCIAWLDPLTRIGHFEPVGTHLDFQRQGLGKAVLLWAFERMRERGMRKANVFTPEDNRAAVALYESVGLHQVNRMVQYQKTLPKEKAHAG